MGILWEQLSCRHDLHIPCTWYTAWRPFWGTTVAWQQIMKVLNHMIRFLMDEGCWERKWKQNHFVSLWLKLTGKWNTLNTSLDLFLFFSNALYVCTAVGVQLLFIALHVGTLSLRVLLSYFRSSVLGFHVFPLRYEWGGLWFQEFYSWRLRAAVGSCLRNLKDSFRAFVKQTNQQKTLKNV